jgi:LysR family hydrogen peroxide-inducible transcriptional activator
MGAIPTIAPYLLPTVLRKVGDQFPSAKMSVSENTTEKLLKRVSNGEIDLGFVAKPTKAKYLTIEPLFEEPILLALPADHNLASESEISIEDIQHEPFVFLGDEHCLSESIDSFCNSKNFQPIGTTRIEQLITVQNLVAMGYGLSFVPAMATTQDANSGVVYRKLAGEQPTRTISACWNPYRFQGQLLTKFIASVRQFCEGYDFAPSACNIS